MGCTPSSSSNARYQIRVQPSIDIERSGSGLSRGMSFDDGSFQSSSGERSHSRQHSSAALSTESPGNRNKHRSSVPHMSLGEAVLRSYSYLQVSDAARVSGRRGLSDRLRPSSKSSEFRKSASHGHDLDRRFRDGNEEITRNGIDGETIATSMKSVVEARDWESVEYPRCTTLPFDDWFSRGNSSGMQMTLNGGSESQRDQDIRCLDADLAGSIPGLVKAMPQFNDEVQELDPYPSYPTLSVEPVSLSYSPTSPANQSLTRTEELKREWLSSFNSSRTLHANPSRSKPHLRSSSRDIGSQQLSGFSSRSDLLRSASLIDRTIYFDHYTLRDRFIRIMNPLNRVQMTNKDLLIREWVFSEEYLYRSSEPSYFEDICRLSPEKQSQFLLEVSFGSQGLRANQSTNDFHSCASMPSLTASSIPTPPTDADVCPIVSALVECVREQRRRGGDSSFVCDVLLDIAREDIVNGGTYSSLALRSTSSNALATGSLSTMAPIEGGTMSTAFASQASIQLHGDRVVDTIGSHSMSSALRLSSTSRWIRDGIFRTGKAALRELTEEEIENWMGSWESVSIRYARGSRY